MFFKFEKGQDDRRDFHRRGNVCEDGEPKTPTSLDTRFSPQVAGAERETFFAACVFVMSLFF
jgi:hypothetical protein